MHNSNALAKSPAFDISNRLSHDAPGVVEPSGAFPLNTAQNAEPAKTTIPMYWIPTRTYSTPTAMFIPRQATKTITATMKKPTIRVQPCEVANPSAPKSVNK